MQMYLLLDIALMYTEAESGQDILIPSKIKNK